MTDKRSKMHGTPVSKAEVLADLGHPSTWAALARKVEFEKGLRRGADDLDISGIRGYGRIKGYLAKLEEMLIRPPGADTALVSDEENIRIRQKVIMETSAEIATYRMRLTALERSAEAVETFIGHVRFWLDYCEKQTLQDPDEESDDEMRAMVVESNQKLVAEIATLHQELQTYDALLRRLKKI